MTSTASEPRPSWRSTGTPSITFTNTMIDVCGADLYAITGEPAIRGVIKPVVPYVLKYSEFTDALMGHRKAVRPIPRSTARTSR